MKNYLLAAHEVLRLMGDLGPGDDKAFRGDLVLMDRDTAPLLGSVLTSLWFIRQMRTSSPSATSSMGTPGAGGGPGS